MTTFAAPSPVSSNDHDLTPSQWVLKIVRGAKPFARLAASRAMVGRNRSRTDPTTGRFTHAEIAGLVNNAFDRFEHQLSALPPEPTVGSRQNVMLAALTLDAL